MSNKPFNPVQDITDFHEKFGLDYNGPPRLLHPDLWNFRMKFVMEELNEWAEAHASQPSDVSMEDSLDAAVDIVYVALGTIYMQGMGHLFEEAWEKVHRANMQKVRCENEGDSKRGSTFDVIKPEGWQAPDHSDLIKRARQG